NDDLVAVTQRATYEESFEFKLNRSLDPTLDPTLDFTPDPNNVDGNGHKIFEFSYWGKANRNSEKRESFTGVMETFQLKDGWYQASARFTVPEGVKLVRCFELSNVLGNWTTLEIRKHQMQLVSDAITEAKYSDEVNLPTLDDQQVERREAFQKLARYEQEAAALMLRKWQLERASKSGVKHNLKSQIEALQTEVATLQSSYDDEVGKFENYWCKITAKHSGKVIGVEGGKTNDGANVLQWGWQNVDNQKWRFKPVDKPADKPAEYYKIVCKHSATEKVLNVNEPRNRNGGNISLWHSANVDHQKWKREPVDNNSAYKIIAKHSGKVLDVSQGHSADGTNIQQWDWSNVENQKWTIETLEEHCNNNIQDANQKLGNKRTELARAESQLRDINEAQNRLSIVTARLDFVQREMAVLTSGQSGKEPVALEMATLKTDTRKLKTQGALLNFVCPASRITAIETCEGNVQLSYFDDQGKMRQTNFDATADSRNAQFEQWLPDQLPVSLQLSGDGSINYGNLNLANRSFTVEFWAKRDQLDRMAMILSQGETEVNKGLHIGFRSDGKFTFAFYSDDLDTDSPYNDFEWHHWVCVYELEGKTRTIYRDGEQIGQDHANKIYQGSGNLVLGQRFDAKHSFVGRLAEVRIWQVALTQEEIKINSKIRLSGNEPGLLAYYPLHEPSQVRDLTGSQKDAEILGTASWCRSTVPIGQFKPSEISLDGVDDYLEIANSEAINFATNQDFTVEAWIKADRIQQDTKNTDNDIIEKWSGQSGYPYVIRYVNTSGKIYAARYDGTKSASINST
ncbi:MAG: LamG-like jellyroll fold domain-containing protein, partial [bacterium]